ncbi:CdaR family transcriptional regulator [Leucobacter sp. wl10]|uniref:PucR family transcriptional regulator n=1 Tax=Leucobacter sp. wl10 TaxID=2304677 RepID=UPI000E5A44F6|nr:helix-turn-helix domain-containing protein [Leucobacter sp. wl10]RGE20384.1 hypothetical protein D1J51_09400 [Leucobacter sp. wl10]
MVDELFDALLRALGAHALWYAPPRPGPPLPRTTMFVEPDVPIDPLSAQIVTADQLAAGLVPPSARVRLVFVADAARSSPDDAPAGAAVIATDLAPVTLCNRVAEVLRAERDELRAAQDTQRLLVALLTGGPEARRRALSQLPAPSDPEAAYTNVVVIEAGSRGARSTAEPGLRAVFPEAAILRIGDRLVVLQPERTRYARLERTQKEGLTRLLDEIDGRAAVGGNAREREVLDIPFAIASHILYVSARIPRLRPRRVYTQDEYGIYYVLGLIQEQFRQRFGRDDPLSLIHPGMVALIRYDREHRTDLRETLFMYLAYDRNLKMTAERMFSHRNTVYNKLRRIRQILDEDLEDPKLRFSLQFSHLLITYLGERVPAEW